MRDGEGIISRRKCDLFRIHDCEVTADVQQIKVMMIDNYAEYYTVTVRLLRRTQRRRALTTR